MGHSIHNIDKRINNANIFPQPSLIRFTKGADILGHDCTVYAKWASDDLKAEKSLYKYDETSKNYLRTSKW